MAQSKNNSQERAFELELITAQAKALAQEKGILAHFSHSNQLLRWYYSTTQNAQNLMSYAEWLSLGFKVKSGTKSQFSLWLIPEIYKGAKQTKFHANICLRKANGTKEAPYYALFSFQEVEEKE